MPLNDVGYGWPNFQDLSFSKAGIERVNEFSLKQRLLGDDLTRRKAGA